MLVEFHGCDSPSDWAVARDVAVKAWELGRKKHAEGWVTWAHRGTVHTRWRRVRQHDQPHRLEWILVVHANLEPSDV